MVSAVDSEIESGKGSRGCCHSCSKFGQLFCCRSNEDAEPPRQVFSPEQLIVQEELTSLHPIKETLKTGSLIIVEASPTEDAPWFAINLAAVDAIDPGNSSEFADIVLHVNVRVPQQYLVRNTKRRGAWGNEETTTHIWPFPFRVGESFTMQILVSEAEFQIAVNGQHYCTYAFRQPPVHCAKLLACTGLRNPRITFTTTDVYPIDTTEPPAVPERKKRGHDIIKKEYQTHREQQADLVWGPNMLAALPHGLPEGSELFIEARLRSTLHSFHVELSDGVQEWPHALVPFHVSPRPHVRPHAPRQLVVFNSWDGKWGEERRQFTAHFVPCTKVVLKIGQRGGGWCVWSDNVLLGELERRVDPAAAKFLRIRGDIIPLNIYIQAIDYNILKS